MTYSCNRIERLIWLNYKKTLGTIVIKRKLYIYSSFGVKAEEERNRAYEEKNESSLVSGSVTISRAGSFLAIVILLYKMYLATVVPAARLKIAVR